MKSLFRSFTKPETPQVNRRLILLNLGCGGQAHPDWVNVDFHEKGPGTIHHDLRQPLPFETATCAVVYHSHVLEHFSRSFAPVFLGECFRVLVPGGVMRVVVPDLETIARLYLRYLDGALAGEAGAAARYEWMTLELLDQMVRECSGGEMFNYWRQDPIPAEDFVLERAGAEMRRFLHELRHRSTRGLVTVQTNALPLAEPTPKQLAQFRAKGEVHKWMYDRYSLVRLVKNIGFTDTKVCAANESRIPNFNSYQLDLNPDGTVRKPDSLFVEAVKP